MFNWITEIKLRLREDKLRRDRLLLERECIRAYDGARVIEETAKRYMEDATKKAERQRQDWLAHKAVAEELLDLTEDDIANERAQNALRKTRKPAISFSLPRLRAVRSKNV